MDQTYHKTFTAKNQKSQEMKGTASLNIKSSATSQRQEQLLQHKFAGKRELQQLSGSKSRASVATTKRLGTAHANRPGAEATTMPREVQINVQQSEEPTPARSQEEDVQLQSKKMIKRRKSPGQPTPKKERSR